MTAVECPECGASGTVSENPILEDTYECSRCIIGFTGDGEVLD